MAIAIGAFIGGEGARRDLGPEHWIFLIAGSAGLLASLRGLSIGQSTRPWLTGLTLGGVTATLLLVAENLVAPATREIDLHRPGVAPFKSTSLMQKSARNSLLPPKSSTSGGGGEYEAW